MNALIVAWRPNEPHPDGWRPVGRLEHDGQLYRFCYTGGARRPGFRPFSQMEDLTKVYESSELFPLFANRLLPRSRPEYDAFLRWSGFDASDPPDPILVLGVSEGIRQTDAVEVFPCPTPDRNGYYLSKFFVHGIRWMSPATLSRIESLQPGEPLRLLADLQNQVDPQAVALRTEVDRTMIGYVPRYLARDVWQLVQRCNLDFIQVVVERLNLDAPTQNRVLCRLQTCWPEGFQPCSGTDFAPIPVGISARCD